jgi:rhodanese-related sulfurtransferase
MIKPNSPLFTFLIITIFIFAFCEIGISANESSSESQILETRKILVEGGGHYINVRAAGLKTMLKNKDFVLINVHIPYEGEIEQTDFFIPFNEIEQNLNKLPANKDAKIFLYCRTDRMSIIAARTLVRLVYTNIWHLDGGMISWEKAGYQLLHRVR